MGLTLGPTIPRYVFYHLNAFDCHLHKAFRGPFKGIADDAFNLLICKECSSVESVLKECRRFEEAKCHCVAHSFTRLPHTAATSSCADAGTWTHADPLTTIVRREIDAMVPAIAPQYSHARNAPTVAPIQAVVREEFANLGIHPVCGGYGISNPHGTIVKLVV